MEERWTSLCTYMPPPVAEALLRVPPAERETVQEVRLRAGASLQLSTALENRSLGIAVTASQVQDCFFRLCSQAVHTHQEELRQGFITTEDGFRVGVAGTAVVKDGTVTSYRAVTSLCIRLSRVVVGCAAPLLGLVDSEEGLRGMLLCGAPACGKTTLLRDLASRLSRKRRIAVVDERQELSLGGLSECDVLRGCPKAVGILQAVRTLAPDAIVVDEVGDEEEWQAVARSVFCGVPVIASAHIRDERELRARGTLMNVLRNGGFSWLAFLPPRHRINEAIRIRRVEEWLEDGGDRTDRVCLFGGGAFGGKAAL